MTRYIKGWKVYQAQEQTEQQKKIALVKWKAISQIFTVRSAADEFAKLARKQFATSDIQVRAEYTRDQITVKV